MSKLIRSVASAFRSTTPRAGQSHVGVFSVVHGKHGSVEKLGARAANSKCAGECTCRCCK